MNLFNRYCFIGCDKPFNESEVVVFGAPFDGTSSYRPGSRFAPNKIRIDSYGLETYSPYMDMDLEDKNIHDAGDLDFTFGNKYAVVDMIKEYTQYLVSNNKKPFMIGGEHLVSLPVISTLYQKHKDMVLLHFDAHTDLRTDYMGEELSHATVIKQVWNFMGDNKIFQFGIRSGLREEFQWAMEGNHTFINKYNCEKLQEIIQQIGDKPVYITIDLDVLDPSIFPGTGTPEPGGIFFKEMLEVINRLSQLNIIGADVVELAPDYDPSGVSTAVACKVIRELLLTL